MGKPSETEEEQTQIVLRVPASWVERAERLRPKLMRPGVSLTRTDVLRAAIVEGLDKLEQEDQGDEKAPAPKARRVPQEPVVRPGERR